MTNDLIAMDLGSAYLAHHGVKGMKWGVRHDRKTRRALYKDSRKNMRRVTHDWNERRLRLEQTGLDLARLSDKDVVLKKGSKAYRTVRDADPFGKDTLNRMFVSTGDRDRRVYRSTMPQFDNLGKLSKFIPGNGRSYYEHTYELAKNVRIASDKAAYNMYRDMVANHLQTSDHARRAAAMTYGTKNPDAVAKASFINFYQNAGKTKNKNAIDYFQKLKERGYDGIRDYNDRLTLTDNPYIVFDSGSFKNKRTYTLNKEDVLGARVSLYDKKGNKT